MAGDIEQPFAFNFQVETAISDSISFGRFENESLSWERRSSFSHNRYLEEVEKFSKPGSVNEKKAYFEAHFKKKRALLGQNSLESHTTENDVSEQVNQRADIEIINIENHDGPFDDSSVSSQNHGDHVTEFEEMPKLEISSSNPKFENSLSTIGGSMYGDLNGVNAEKNELDHSGENKFSTFVGNEPEVVIKQDVKNNGMSENTRSEVMESVPKLVKKTSKSSSGSQQTLTSKMTSKRETKASKPLANNYQNRRIISGAALKSPEIVSNKSKGEPSPKTCSEAHSSKTSTLRTNAVRRTPKVEGSKVLKGRSILESRSSEKAQTSGVSYSSSLKLESRSYPSTTTRQNRSVVNSAMQDTGKKNSASNFRSTDLTERRKQVKADSEIKKLPKNLDIRSKPVTSSYGTFRPDSDGKKKLRKITERAIEKKRKAQEVSQALLSSSKVRNSSSKSTTAASSSHLLLRRYINSSASETPNTSKNISFRSAVHVEASDSCSSCPSVNQEFRSEAAVSVTENKRKKELAKKKESNVPKSRVLESCRTSKQGVDGKQKVGAQRSMNLTGRRDIKGVAGSGIGRYNVGVRS